MPVTYEEKLACAKRELALRERVYKQRVADGRMTINLAQREIETMRAIADDYAILARDERLL